MNHKFKIILFLLLNLVTSNYLQAKPLVFGHRGFRGKYTENSLQAFKQAVSLGVDGVELDVWVCKTGELVVFHDRTLERLTSGKGNIFDKTFNELRALKLPNNEQIPTLSEVLAQIKHACVVNIELKGPNTAKSVAQVIQTFIQKHGWHKQDFMVSSFNHPELIKFHKLMPQIPFGPIIDGLMLGKAKFAQAMGADYLVINFEYASQALVHDAHKRKLKIYAYTVNDSVDIANMQKLKLDGIISDYPNLVL